MVVSGSHNLHPPDGKDYKWYISGIFPANRGIICHRSHLLREPETTIDSGVYQQFFFHNHDASMGRARKNFPIHEWLVFMVFMAGKYTIVPWMVWDIVTFWFGFVKNCKTYPSFIEPEVFHHAC